MYGNGLQHRLDSVQTMIELIAKKLIRLQPMQTILNYFRYNVIFSTAFESQRILLYASMPPINKQ